MLMATHTVVEAQKVIVGTGAFSCGKFLEDKQQFATLLDAEYFAWAQGFLSGLNVKYFLSRESATDLSDHEALELWIENYCGENPLDSYVTATTKLWRELRIMQGLEQDSRFKPKD